MISLKNSKMKPRKFTKKEMQRIMEWVTDGLRKPILGGLKPSKRRPKRKLNV